MIKSEIEDHKHITHLQERCRLKETSACPLAAASSSVEAAAGERLKEVNDSHCCGWATHQ